MQPEPTFCEDCDHVMRGGKSEPPFRWLCAMHKRLEGFGFVSRTMWDNTEPYLRCNQVNGGMCPLFKKPSHGQMSMGELTQDINQERNDGS